MVWGHWREVVGPHLPRAVAGDSQPGHITRNNVWRRAISSHFSAPPGGGSFAFDEPSESGRVALGVREKEPLPASACEQRTLYLL